MKLRLFIIVLSAMLSGCDRGKPVGNDILIYRRSFTMCFGEVQNIELTEYYPYHAPNERRIRAIIRLGNQCFWRDIEKKKETYDALCEKYGDMTFNDETIVGPGGEPTTSADSFVSVEIVSDADYDDEHPAGSSLADCFIFKAFSIKPFVDSGYTDYEREIEIEGLTKTTKSDLYPVSQRISYLTAYDLTMLRGATDRIPIDLAFESLPTLSQTHTFTVTFTDETGKTFSDSIEMTFD